MPLVILLVFLRLLTERAASSLWFVLVLGLVTVGDQGTSLRGDWLLAAVYAAVLAGSLLFVLLRFGLLAAAIGMMVGSWFWSRPLTTDPQSWFFHSTVITVIAVLGLTVWGMRAALAGRPLFRDELA